MKKAKSIVLELLENKPYWLYVSIQPSGCNECPFAEIFDETDPPNRVDPDEAYYQCQLIKEKVWGEDPKCNTEDWIEKL